MVTDKPTGTERSACLNINHEVAGSIPDFSTILNVN